MLDWEKVRWLLLRQQRHEVDNMPEQQHRRAFLTNDVVPVVNEQGLQRAAMSGNGGGSGAEPLMGMKKCGEDLDRSESLTRVAQRLRRQSEFAPASWSG